MQQRNSMYGARYGIWGENPYGPTAIGTGLETAHGVQGLFNNYYKNRLANENATKAELENTHLQQTLPGLIEAQNAKSAADTKYYPLQEKSKLDYSNQQIREMAARVGLTQSQMREALARTALANAQTGKVMEVGDPTYPFRTIYDRWNKAAPGSMEKTYYGNLLDQMGGGGASFNIGSSSRKEEVMNVPGVPGLPKSLHEILPNSGINGLNVNPFTVSSHSMKGAQYGEQNDDGTYNSMESPTTASETRNQIRGEAEQESQSINPVIQKGITPYQGAFPTLRLGKDILTANLNPNSKKGKEARERLYNFSLASRFVPEVSAMSARQATGQSPGIELTREFKNSMFPNLPASYAGNFIPSDIQQSAASAYPETQAKMANAAIKQERSGYPSTLPSAPAWSQSGGNNQNNLWGGRFINGEFVPFDRLNEQGKNQEKPQPSTTQLQWQAELAIAQGADPEKVYAILKQIQGGG